MRLEIIAKDGVGGWIGWASLQESHSSESATSLVVTTHRLTGNSGRIRPLFSIRQYRTLSRRASGHRHGGEVGHGGLDSLGWILEVLH